MFMRVRGAELDIGNIIDAPIDLLMELNRLTGLEGGDILDGISEAATGLQSGRPPSQRALMSLAALVWLGRRKTGERIGFEEAVAGLSVFDIELVPDPPAASQQQAREAAPDPTRPGSDPGTAAYYPYAPIPVGDVSPSPGAILAPPSTSTP